MKKIRLDVDALAIDSFATSTGAKDAKGTVRAFSNDSWCYCPTVTDAYSPCTCGTFQQTCGTCIYVYCTGACTHGC